MVKYIYMAKSIIQIKNLKKYFGPFIKAVDGISFDVEEGEVFGFLGPNGAGKTTTIRCLMDFLRPTSGSIKIFGKNAQVDSVELKKISDFWQLKTHFTVIGMDKTISDFKSQSAANQKFYQI